MLGYYGLHKLFGFNIFNAIPTIDSNITYGMLFLIGVLTSIHCISMCGAINLLVCYSTIFNYFRGRMRVVFNKVANVLIIILSFNMLFRCFGTIGVNINSSNDYSDYVASTIYDY